MKYIMHGMSKCPLLPPPLLLACLCPPVSLLPHGCEDGWREVLATAVEEGRGRKRKEEEEGGVRRRKRNCTFSSL